jgi:hypothetical protein
MMGHGCLAGKGATRVLTFGIGLTDDLYGGGVTGSYLLDEEYDDEEDKPFLLFSKLLTTGFRVDVKGIDEEELNERRFEADADDICGLIVITDGFPLWTLVDNLASKSPLIGIL